MRFSGLPISSRLPEPCGCRPQRRFWLRLAAAALGLVFSALAASAQNVVINEIMFHPGLGQPGEPGYVAEDTRKEFIELLNLGSEPVILKGWRFETGVGFVFPDVTIAAGGFLVVAADADVDRFRAAWSSEVPGLGTAAVIGGWTGKLSNNGETIELVDAFGSRVDEVAYSTQGDWAQRREGGPYPGQESWWRGWKWSNGADGEGKSLELINAELPNDYGQNWAASLNAGGTPGAPNSAAETGTLAFITRVRHQPPVPKSTDLVTVTAQLVPKPATAATVTLFSRIDGAEPFSPTAMFDDGLHGDGDAGDGVYGVVLPPQPHLTIVEFYVQAAAFDQVRTWPGPVDDQGAQNANALYQVDDAIYSGSQPIYRLIVPLREYAAWTNLMDATSAGRFSDAAMHGTFICVDGRGTDVRYRVGIRNRGAGTRAARPHNLHIAFPDDDPWRGMGSLGLNTRTVHSQVAGSAFFARTGLPVSRGHPAQVRVNGANRAHLTPTESADTYQFGSYYAFEPYGREWVEKEFPSDPDGNLYKAVWYLDYAKLDNNGGDLRYLGEDSSRYRQMYSASGPTSAAGAYTKQTNGSEDDWTDLIGLARTLDTAPAAAYLGEVSRVVNIDEWLLYFAVNSLAGNMETTLATGTGDDYWLFAGKNDRRFQILPHDLDTVLGQGDIGPEYGRSIWRATRLPVINRFLSQPAIAWRYCVILKELANTVFAPEQANAILEESLGSWVPGSVIDAMKDFVIQRRAAVLAQIAPVFTSPVQLSEVLARSSAGSSWVEVVNIAGEPLDLADYSLTDEPGLPRKWVFPSAILPPNGFLTVECNSQALPSMTNTGFGLNASGGAIWLFAPPTAGGAIVDAVLYGLQAADFSIGRGDEGKWMLCHPTPGAANVAVALGSPASLTLNEWMASPVSGPDWFELFNRGDRPVALAGLSFNDNLLAPGSEPIPGLSFIGTGPGAFQVFTADEEVFKGPDHTRFKLNADGDSIGLFGPDGLLIDAVVFGPQNEGVSEGRTIDAGERFARFARPTPGGPNRTGDLRIARAEMTPGGFALSFAGEPEATYSVWVTDSLEPASWQELQRVPSPPGGGPVTVVDPSTRRGARYYRITALQAP